MFAGELERLSPRELGTTGLLNQNARTTAGRVQTAEDVMDQANEDGYRDSNGQPFSNIGDFIYAVERDHIEHGKVSTRRRAPSAKQRRAKIMARAQENPQPRYRYSIEIYDQSGALTDGDARAMRELLETNDRRLAIESAAANLHRGYDARVIDNTKTRGRIIFERSLAGGKVWTNSDNRPRRNPHKSHGKLTAARSAKTTAGYKLARDAYQEARRMEHSGAASKTVAAMYRKAERLLKRVSRVGAHTEGPVGRLPNPLIVRYAVKGRIGRTDLYLTPEKLSTSDPERAQLFLERRKAQQAASDENKLKAANGAKVWRGIAWGVEKLVLNRQFNPASTRTSSDVRSPTKTSTSTYAHTAGNITVTGGAGAGATTKVVVRRNPGFFGIEPGATTPQRVTKIRPVVDKLTGEKGEIVATAPGGYVKVKWHGRAKATLIKRSEIKRGSYGNPNGAQSPKEGREVIAEAKEYLNKTWDHTETENRAFHQLVHAYEWAGFDHVRAAEAASRELNKKRKRKFKNPGLLEIAGGLQALDYLKKRKIPNPSDPLHLLALESIHYVNTGVGAQFLRKAIERAEAARNAMPVRERAQATKLILLAKRELRKKNPTAHIKLATARTKKGLVLERKAKDMLSVSIELSHKAAHEQNEKRADKLQAESDRLWDKGIALEKRALAAGKYTQGAVGKLPNPSVRSISQKFQGRVSDAVRELKAASTAPSDLARIGKLVLLKLKGRAAALRIPGAVVAADTREKLWIAGDRAPLLTTKAKPGTLLDFGEIDKIVYLTAKKHIGGGETYEYDHDFESPKPHLMIDAEGMPLIRGGGYQIKAAGITG